MRAVIESPNVRLNIEAVVGKREAERRDGTRACVRSDGVLGAMAGNGSVYVAASAEIVLRRLV